MDPTCAPHIVPVDALSKGQPEQGSFHMKSTLASIVAAVVLAAGVPALNVDQTLFPPWFCQLLPPFCAGRM